MEALGAVDDFDVGKVLTDGRIELQEIPTEWYEACEELEERGAVVSAIDR